MGIKIGILILNWNGWADTLECLESIFQLDYKDFKVVVCDNASTDDSLIYIKKWADGKIRLLNNFLFKKELKINFPIEYNIYKYDGNEFLCLKNTRSNVTFIFNDFNRGYAGGNNVGLKFFLLDKEISYVWILNNDTVVEQNSLSFLINKAKFNANYGIIGSTILYYSEPSVVQMQAGGKFNIYTGSNRFIGGLRKNDCLLEEDEVLSKVTHISGASSFVSRDFIETVGLMEERYFLYFEEIDWATRGRDFFQLGYAPEAIVYHKDGATIGPITQRDNISEIADYFGVKSRFTFIRKFYPLLLPLHYLFFLKLIINRVKRKQFKRIPKLIKASLNFWS